MVEEEDHLTEMKKVLAKAGLLYLQNGSSLVKAMPKTFEEKQILSQLRKFQMKKPGPWQLIRICISTLEGEKELTMLFVQLRCSLYC